MDLILSAAELQALTGYKRPAEQLRELLRQGFWRARRGANTGRVILEREHYEAVCSGADGRKPKPTLRAPELRAI